MALKLKITIDNRVIEKILLNARKTIDGNIIVRDHPDIDIFIISGKNKVVAMPKEQMDDEIYDQRLIAVILYNLFFLLFQTSVTKSSPSMMT